MEMLDEYQDSMAQTVAGPDVAVANMAGMAHHRHTPDSPLVSLRKFPFSLYPDLDTLHSVKESHPEEDLSDPDRQDDESGEELLQQPMQANNHSSADNTPAPTPLAHLNSLMSQSNPHFLAKIKLENEMDMLNNKSGLEALQAAMSSGFNLPFSFTAPGAFLAPGQQQQQQQQQAGHSGHPAAAAAAAAATGSPHGQQSSSATANSTNNGERSSNNNLTSSASSHSSESSQGSGRNNGLEITSQRESAAGPGNLTGGGHSAASSGGQGQQSAHQQQTSWSFEEQFKQVRQLYEVNDDPKRKVFLDDLFSFMQKRGTPINRLPIMAKSVLDLFELYNLVIARGGLVDVINKKLWQEIIKGLHLPSSITSAAFTLRTQYMKYLYPYECEKKHLSSPAELQAAIDGNRREGRRSNYGNYGGGGGSVDGLVRSPHTPGSLASLHPLSLVAAAASGQHQVGPQGLVNGSAAHTPMPHHPHHPQHQQGGGLGQPLNAGMAPEIEVRVAEYMKQLQREMGRKATGSPVQHHLPSNLSPSPPPQASAVRSPPPTSREQAAFLEMSRLTLWNMYNNNIHPGLGYAQAASPPHGSHSPPPQPISPEPQKEALDLGLRSSPSSSSTRHSPPSSNGSMNIKREIDTVVSPHTSTANKRLCRDEDSPPRETVTSALPGTHIKIENRGDGRDNSLVVSMELNGVMYQGVLFAQTDGSVAANNNENKASTRNVVS